MSIRHNHPHDGLSTAWWIASGLLAACITIAWAGSRDHIVRPAPLLCFDLATPATPLTLPATTPTATQPVSHESRVTVPRSVDPTPAAVAELSIINPLRQRAGDPVSPTMLATPVDPPAPIDDVRYQRLDRAGVFHRGEIDRLTRRQAITKSDSANDACRQAVLDYLAQAAQNRPRTESFEVTLIQLSELPELQPAIEPGEIDRQAIAEEAISMDEATERVKRAEVGDDGFVSISDTLTNIQPSDGMMPEDYAGPRFREAGEVPMPEGASRDWPLYAFWWEAPATSHRPLYFEQPNLERHGYSRGLAQPILSGAHFFATIPMLPYLMGANPPHQPIYTLGHYRPGSYAPYQIHYPPLSLKGALAEGGVTAGLIFLIP